jgi:hypothetical protein
MPVALMRDSCDAALLGPRVVRALPPAGGGSRSKPWLARLLAGQARDSRELVAGAGAAGPGEAARDDQPHPEEQH